ncbi:MAG: hypothetical protein VB072_02470 [Lentimicrobium sp.]|jgi:acylphosphatase|nr:hypothetical protein [Lentimicrobium sp.]MEA5109264.1 hypothetical protein [Lentimicrobium sp.]HCT70073.1 hypothetical protein [Bacteroidales bacterium]
MTTCSMITFHRATYDDGFGFACMQAAYKLGICGRMDYSPFQGVTILAEGEEDNLSAFIDWIIQHAGYINHFSNQQLNRQPFNYKEFDIYRHTA